MMQGYNIQAAFLKFRAEDGVRTQESRAGYHFWCLRKETPVPGKKKTAMIVEEVFEPQLALQSAPHITIPLWTIHTTQEVTNSSFFEIAYKDVGNITDAKQKWEHAKKYLSQQGYKFGFKYYGLLDPKSRYAMQNFIYNVLAKVMNITPVIFIEKGVFKSQIAEQALLNSSKLTPPRIPSKTAYKIVAAIQMFKSSKISLERNAHHFLMLVKNERDFSGDKYIQALHGFPMQYSKGRTGLDRIFSPFSLKTRNAILKIYSITAPSEAVGLQAATVRNEHWIIPKAMQVVYDKENALEVWMKLCTFVQWLNSANIKYSSLGPEVGFFGGQAVSDGNSAFSSLGLILKQLTRQSNFNMPRFKGVTAPGIANPMLSEEAIQQYMSDSIVLKSIP